MSLGSRHPTAVEHRAGTQAWLSRRASVKRDAASTVVAQRIRSCLDPAQHPSHHREVTELHQGDTDDRGQRVGPVVEGVDAE